MKRLPFYVAALAVLSAGAATAQGQDYLELYASPSKLSANVSFPVGGPFALEVGASSAYGGKSSLYGGAKAIFSVPVAPPYQGKVEPYYGTTLSVALSFPAKLSLGGAAYVGANFPITQNLRWYFELGPSFDLLPNAGVTFGGSTQIGFKYFF